MPRPDKVRVASAQLQGLAVRIRAQGLTYDDVAGEVAEILGALPADQRRVAVERALEVVSRPAVLDAEPWRTVERAFLQRVLDRLA